jgi:hypothetical protein
MSEIDSEIKPTFKTFKERYNSDEEYRKKHLEYIKAKVPCECGMMVARNNTTKHRETNRHINKMATNNQKIITNEEYEALQKEIRILKKKLNKN